MSLRRRQAWSLLSVSLVALLLALPTLAQGPPPPGGPPPPPPRPGGKGAVGRISAVSGTAITVQGPWGEKATFTLSSSATITLEDQTAQVGDLTVGLFAAVTSADGTTATAIDAHTHPGPPPGGPPPGGPPPGGPPPPDGPPPGGPPPPGQ